MYNPLYVLVYLFVFFFEQTNYEEVCPEIASLALDVVGAYISWIDIALVANDRFIE